MKVDIVKDYGTHTYKETWESSESFCPNCGTKSVWSDSGPGDYYEGPASVCISCNFEGTTLPWSIADGVCLEAIEQIKKALSEGKKER